MSNPQQPEVGRSRKTASQDPDAVAGVAASGAPAQTEPAGPVPAENEPGHHPEHEQDKPDLDAFAARLGVAGEGSAATPTPPPQDRPADQPAPPQSPPAARSRSLACHLVDAACASVRIPLAVLRAVRRRLR